MDLRRSKKPKQVSVAPPSSPKTGSVLRAADSSGVMKQPSRQISRSRKKGNASTVDIASNTDAGMTVGGFFLELFKIIVLSLVIIIPVRYFLVQPFFVKGDSMEPNFSNGEYLLIDEISYRFNEPSRGDVVVFRAPHSVGTYYIKRVIGLPGETVEVNDGNVIVTNDDYPRGVELEEKYLSSQLQTPGNATLELGDDEYFVLGDNRGQSSDSRVIGGIPYDNIVGRAWVRGWPIPSAGAIHLPEYAFIGND